MNGCNAFLNEKSWSPFNQQPRTSGTAFVKTFSKKSLEEDFFFSKPIEIILQEMRKLLLFDALSVWKESSFTFHEKLKRGKNSREIKNEPKCNLLTWLNHQKTSRQFTWWWTDFVFATFSLGNILRKMKNVQPSVLHNF